MIDLRALREDPDRLRASQRARGEDDTVIDIVLELDERRRSALTSFEQLRAEQKSAGKLVSKAQGDERQALLDRAKELSQQVKEAEAEAGRLEDELNAAVKRVPNLIEDEAPHGGEQDFVLIETVGTPREFDFEPKDHLELGELLGAIDMERGAKVSGARFYYLTGVGALLQYALLNLAMEQAVEAGFIPMYPPVLVKPEAMEGTGFLGAHADEVYRLREEDLYLVGTAEVPLAAYHMNEILAELPKRYVGWSSCFRREAGSYGKDTRGIIRVHQFDKVEMFSYCHPDEAHAEHLRLLLDVELHRVPGPPARRTVPQRGERQERTCRHPQRDPRDHPVDRRDPGEPPAGRRLGPGTEGPAEVPRPRGPRTHPLTEEPGRSGRL